jgi:2-hydroxychromene-2-carboxylate isomerase
VPAIRIRHFTDPGCPWAFSAEPRLRRLEWLYGDALEWETIMVVLSENPEDYADRGFTPEKQAAGMKMLFDRYGMPIDWSERERMPATADACRAVVAARLHAPGSERALLRRFRVLAMGGGLLDDPALRRRAAAGAGLDPDELDGWLADDDVAQAMDADRAAARSPSPAALALDHKLGGPPGERRYTCPSLELLAGDGVFALPGFQPPECYEVVVANLAPSLERRADPASVEEVLAWAGIPLATAEVAGVADCAIDEVRAELSRVAVFDPVGGDGYWSLAGV